ncbi:MAG: hypothetical protein ACRDF8_00805 [Chloroflexota bacterium]
MNVSDLHDRVADAFTHFRDLLQQAHEAGLSVTVELDNGGPPGTPSIQGEHLAGGTISFEHDF